MVIVSVALAAFAAGAALGAEAQRRATVRELGQRRAAAGSGARPGASSALGGPDDSSVLGGLERYRLGGPAVEVDEASLLRHMAFTERQAAGAVLSVARGYRPTTRERQQRRERLYGN